MISLIVWLIIIGAGLYLVEGAPIDPFFIRAIRVIGIIFALLIILQMLGFVNVVPTIR